MSRSDKYFQFPVAALRHHKNLNEVTQEEMRNRLHVIVDYCMLDVGHAIVMRNSEDAISAQCERYASSHSLNYDTDDDHQRAWLCGAATLNVQVSYVSSHSGKESQKIISSLNGGRKQIRLRTDLLWDAINDPDWTWRELATLCAVYAGIGAASMKRLSFDYIAIMALGYSSKDEIKTAKESKLLLDRRKTGYTVRKLFDRGLFARVSPNYRHNYYSNSMSLIGLANEMVKTVESKPSPSQVTKSIRAKLEAAKPIKKDRKLKTNPSDDALRQQQVIREIYSAADTKPNPMA